MARVTISDVARRANVSKTAVSFAFNSPGQLSPDTRDRILHIAGELGYRPDPVARTMTTKRTGSIGLLLPQAVHTAFANPFYPLVIEGISSVCDAHEYSLLLVSPVRGSVEEALGRAAVDGFISIGMDEAELPISHILRREMPVVLVDAGDREGETPRVNISDRVGARECARHLLELGHRDVLVVAIQSYDETRPLQGVPFERLSGYQQAFEQAGIPWREDRVFFARPTREAGREVVLAAMRKGSYTAVLAMADILALGAYDAAQHLGMRIPCDISIAGFDDLPIAGLLHPPLTTVAQPVRETGARAATLLIRSLQDGPGGSEVLETQLCVRGSTGPPRSAM